MPIRFAPILALLACLTLVRAAPAQPAPQPLPGAGSVVPSGAHGTHGWACVPLRADSQAVAILHLPPRGPGVPDGTVRVATQFPERPERLAAWQNRLYIVFRPENEATAQRRVLMLSVEPGALEGSWAVTGEGRLPALPPLPGAGQLLGFAGTAVGPASLMLPASDEGPRLLLLSGPDWGRVSLPQEIRESRDLALASVPEGVAVIDSARGRAWLAAVHEDSAGLHVGWTSRALALPTEPPTPPTVQTRAIALLPQGYLYCTSAPGAPVEVWTATDSARYRLASFPKAPPDCAIAPLVSSGRIALLWSEESPASSAPAPATGALTDSRRTHIVELSAFTGETLYDGPAHFNGPVSSQELKLLAAVLVVIMAVVVLFVLRPAGEGTPISLPRDIILAEPARRIAAGLVDLAVAAVIAGRFTEFSIADLFAPAHLMTDAAPVTGLVAIAAVGFVLGTLGEWLWGRSLGKAAVGCAVAWPGTIQYEGRIEPIVRRPTLWRAAVRNLIKWVIPPVAFAGVFAPDRRHRGDVLAGTAVVEHAGDDEPADEDPGDEDTPGDSDHARPG
jgi:uncharacterized RDD family membrane protein YckC